MLVEHGVKANFLGAVVQRTDVDRLEVTTLISERKKSAFPTRFAACFPRRHLSRDCLKGKRDVFYEELRTYPLTPR